MMDEKKNWTSRLQQRWNLKNRWQVVQVLAVFACTGFTVFFLKRPLFRWMQAAPEHYALLSVVYYILILPVYNVILLFYGFIFGQFHFFWEFEKRMLARLRRKKGDEGQQPG